MKLRKLIGPMKSSSVHFFIEDSKKLYRGDILSDREIWIRVSLYRGEPNLEGLKKYISSKTFQGIPISLEKWTRFYKKDINFPISYRVRDFKS